DGVPHTPPHLSKQQDIPLKSGDRVVVATPGGGGYGDPFHRDPQAVLRDVMLERYSVAQAKDWFGVVIADNGTEIDDAATQTLRKL
ncbi:methylhydantoinase, partial [Alphaproteobacteria bacterium]|nr:methylhydantoinase [Alphaproteobacteria bacterium]